MALNDLRHATHGQTVQDHHCSIGQPCQLFVNRRQCLSVWIGELPVYPDDPGSVPGFIQRADHSANVAVTAGILIRIPRHKNG